MCETFLHNLTQKKNVPALRRFRVDGFKNHFDKKLGNVVMFFGRHFGEPGQVFGEKFLTV